MGSLLATIDSGGDITCPQCDIRFDVEHWDDTYDWYVGDCQCPECGVMLNIHRHKSYSVSVEVIDHA